MAICIGLIAMSYKKRNLFGEQGNSKRKSVRRFHPKQEFGAS